MLKVAISTSRFGTEDSSPLSRLEKAGVEVVPNPYGRRLTEDEVVAHLKGVHGLLAGLEPLTRRVFESAPDLKALARVGIGMAAVDLAAAAELGIKVSNTPDGPTDAVAEMALAALLNLCRGLKQSDREMHKGHWEKTIHPGLKCATVLMVGYGRIGRRTAELIRGFGARILVCDPEITADTLVAGEELTELNTGLQRADVVSLHASSSETILDAAAFAEMKTGTILLNSARGHLVDETQLIAALGNGKVAGAWFDTFVDEPYSGPLTGFDNVLLTPHISTYTRQCRLQMETDAVSNLLRDLEVSIDD